MVDMETVMSGFCDEFPALRKHRFLVLVATATAFFLFALPQVTQVRGGAARRRCTAHRGRHRAARGAGSGVVAACIGISRR